VRANVICLCGDAAYVLMYIAAASHSKEKQTEISDETHHDGNMRRDASPRAKLPLLLGLGL